MSEIQSKTCEIVMKSPDEFLRPFLELLMQMYTLQGDAHATDDEYFRSIPGYVDSLNAAAAEPWDTCLKESEVNW